MEIARMRLLLVVALFGVAGCSKLTAEGAAPRYAISGQILLDTVTGETWHTCEAVGSVGWCPMRRAQLASAEERAQRYIDAALVRGSDNGRAP